MSMGIGRSGVSSASPVGVPSSMPESCSQAAAATETPVCTSSAACSTAFAAAEATRDPLGSCTGLSSGAGR